MQKKDTTSGSFLRIFSILSLNDVNALNSSMVSLGTTTAAAATDSTKNSTIIILVAFVDVVSSLSTLYSPEKYFLLYVETSFQ
jgi:hypothetical protein